MSRQTRLLGPTFRNKNWGGRKTAEVHGCHQRSSSSMISFCFRMTMHHVIMPNWSSMVVAEQDQATGLAFRSPDLNPIENLWHKVALEISKRHPTNKRDLIESLIAAWNSVVTNDHLVKLVNSRPKRCRKVLQSKGWPIKY